ncbi:Retrotransposon gag protein [Abeliophyllum distichum]|uniref:Retrotransposon gag protein n=1 Tax=Abeliophyllum distichum TaxID=126358 RepID=A0ABD1U025_9LAMI
MMGRKIAETMSNKSTKQQSMTLEEGPFLLKVMAVPLARDFKQPKMEKYNGSSDPVDHLKSFVDLMRLQATPDTIMCRAFSPTLRREARDWVATLPPKSIRTFDEFSKSFATHFASIKRVKKTAISLMQLAQDKDKPLKDFIAQATSPAENLGDEPMFKNQGDEPMSEKQDDEHMFKNQGDEPMSEKQGDEPRDGNGADRGGSARSISAPQKF